MITNNDDDDDDCATTTTTTVAYLTTIALYKSIDIIGVIVLLGWVGWVSLWIVEVEFREGDLHSLLSVSDEAEVAGDVIGIGSWKIRRRNLPRLHRLAVDRLAAQRRVRLRKKHSSTQPGKEFM